MPRGNLDAAQKAPYSGVVNWLGANFHKRVLHAFGNNFPRQARNFAGTGVIQAWKVGVDDKLYTNGSLAVQGVFSRATYSMSANGSIADTIIFVANQPCRIIGVRETHATAGSDSGAVTAQIRKLTGVTAITAGVAVLATALDMKATANTPQTGVLSADQRVLELAAGDRLAIDFTGTLTALAGLYVDVLLQPLDTATQTIDVSFVMKANGSLADQSFFTANRPYTVTAIRQVHGVLGTDAGAVNVQVTKDTSTNAPGAGTDLLTNNTNAGFNLKGAINTVQVGSLVATAGVLDLAAGDRLAVDFAGTLTAVADVCVTVSLRQTEAHRIEIPYNFSAAAAQVDQTIFIADRDYDVIEVTEIHATAGTDAGAVNLQLTKDTGTTAPGAGTDLLSNNTNAGFNLKGTANTLQQGTYITGLALGLLKAGDRLALDYAGTLTALVGVGVTVSLRAR